ncbi:MAG: hypothetical protein JSV61_02555 [Anaerolineales bacterium]|nr:MAG: hypothetical protein JSV61_02555 [Anaerolineales bacterium]
MNEKTQFTVDPQGRWLYRVGGISAIVFAIAYVVIVAIFVPLGGMPTGGAEGWLKNMAEDSTSWTAIISLNILTDFLLVPIALARYLALKGVNKSVMLAATVFVFFFPILDLPMTWGNIGSLFELSDQYAAAVNAAQTEAVVTAAMYPSAVMNSQFLGVFNSLAVNVGILLTGFVMLRGIFAKGTAYLGVATGALGVMAVAFGLFESTSSLGFILIVLTAVLNAVWELSVGFRLCKLGWR